MDINSSVHSREEEIAVQGEGNTSGRENIFVDLETCALGDFEHRRGSHESKGRCLAGYRRV